MRADLIYTALAGIAIGGAVGPVLFPMAAAAKTACYVSSIAAAGSLAFGEQSGLFGRMRKRDRILRESSHEIWIQQSASRQALAERQIEIDELVETLVMLDDLSPIEQLHFLKQLNLAELMPIYQESRMLKQAEMEPAIEVAATPVREPEPVFAGNLQWAVDSVVSQSMQPVPTTAIVDDAFPEVDLGRAIAEMMVQGDVPLSVMLACPPRTGKTTLMTVTLAWLHKLTNGGAKVKIYNGKENRDQQTGQLKDRFLGLVDDPTRYEAVESFEAAKEFAEEFDSISQKMNKPRQFPEVIFLDEHNNIRARINGYDQKNGIPKAKGYLNQTDVNVGLIATQGSSRGLFLLITSHSAYVKNIGIDKSYQDGIYSIVLGRGGALDGLYKSLKGASAVVQNTTRANQLLMELQQWEQSPTRDHSKVVALTNLVDGNFGLYFAKYVDLSKVQFEPIVQSQPEVTDDDPWGETDDSEFGDTAADDDRGISQSYMDHLNRRSKPRSEQPQQQPQSTIPPESPLAFLIATLKQWISELPSPPTDAQLKQKLLEVTGQNFSDKALQGLKQELGL